MNLIENITQTIADSQAPLVVNKYDLENNYRHLFNLTHNIVVDAEWGNRLIDRRQLEAVARNTSLTFEERLNIIQRCWRNEPVSLQFLFCDFAYNPLFALYVLHEKYKEPSINPLYELAPTHSCYGLPLLVMKTHQYAFREGLLNYLPLPGKRTYTLIGFFSAIDFELSTGKQKWINALLGCGKNGRKYVGKKRCISGVVRMNGYRMRIRDSFGMFNCGLEKAIVSHGINPLGKNKIHEWEKQFSVDGEPWTKNNMEIPALYDPNGMVRYAMGDVVDLLEAMKIHTNSINQVLQEALGLNADFDIDGIPNTSGKLVWTVLREFIRQKYGSVYKKTFQLTSTFNDKKYKVVEKLRNCELEEYDDEFEKHNTGNDIIHGLAQANIINFVKLAPNDTGIYGSVVLGGRCVNEEWRPCVYEQRINNVVDIDLSSCYGSALEGFDYLFGVPTVVGFDENEKAQTLEQILKTYEDELVPGLWTIYLSGTLTFEQDLLLSKYGLSINKIASQIISNSYSDGEDNPEEGHEIDIAHIQGDIVMTTKQVERAVLTQDSLDVIRKVASDKEWKEIKNLKVEALIFYPKSKELSLDEWVAHDIGTVVRDPDTKRLIDKRSRHWCRIGLREFIGPLKKARKEYKTAMKEAKLAGDKDKTAQLDCLQNKIKLFINTVYGCLASPYFPIGNTVIANNITSKARVGAWMMSKALQTVQSITDGGMFSADKVSYLRPEKDRNRKPGLHVLADRQRLRKHRCIETKPLFPELKTSVKEWLVNGTGFYDPERAKVLDQTCLNHINNFWRHYDLALPFEIECKYEHTALFAVWRNKGDYFLVHTISQENQFTVPDIGVVYGVMKVRGAKKIDHPSKQHMLHIAFPEQIPTYNAIGFYEELRGVNDYQKANNPEDPCTPGNPILKHVVHLFNPNKGKKFATYEEWKNDNKAEQQAKRRFKDKIDNVLLLQAMIDYVFDKRVSLFVQPYQKDLGQVRTSKCGS
jgi:hypothetical protein